MSSIEKIITYVSDLLESIWNILSYPIQLRDDSASALLDLIREYDLDPIYIFTVFVNLVLLSYWGNFRKWNSQTPFIKHSSIITVAASVMFNLWSLLRLLGVIDL